MLISDTQETAALSHIIVLLILGMNATGTDASQERALIAVGSGIAAVAIVTLLIAVPVLCVFLKRSQKSKETQCKRQVCRLSAYTCTHHKNRSSLYM